MINDKILKQEGGDGSTNLQAGVINNHYYGMSNSQVKELFMELFNDNFIRLRKEAAIIAQRRAEEITEAFLAQLIEKSPEVIQELSQPGMQDALFNAQKEYAKSGDKNLGDLLVDLLIERASTPQRNMMQIVLDEALRIIPKMTEQHLDNLTMLFLLKEVGIPTEPNLQSFIDYLEDDIIPFIDEFTGDKIVYSYLEYLGCGHTRTGHHDIIAEIFTRKNIAIFQTGFTKEEFENKVGRVEDFQPILIQSLHSPEQLQFDNMNNESFYPLMKQVNASDKAIGNISKLFGDTLIKDKPVFDLIHSLNCRIGFEHHQIVTQSLFKSMELTSVGIVIAHANYKKKTNRTLDLSKWIK